VNLERRGLLLGLIAAPLVASASNLMKMRGFVLPPLSERWLASYQIGTDEILARWDVASFMELRKPPFKGCWELAPAEIAKLERALARPMQSARQRVLAFGAPNSPFQCRVDIPWRQHFSSDHGKTVLTMQGYDAAWSV
jgi:hypothetical protein